MKRNIFSTILFSSFLLAFSKNLKGSKEDLSIQNSSVEQRELGLATDVADIITTIFDILGIDSGTESTVESPIESTEGSPTAQNSEEESGKQEDQDKDELDFDFGNDHADEIEIANFNATNGDLDYYCKNNPGKWKCMRFSKVTFPPNVDPGNFLPLGSYEFPISGTVSEKLKTSLCESVLDDSDQIEGYPDVKDVILGLDRYPTHPTCDRQSEFWDEFEEVVDIAILRQTNDHRLACTVMEVPTLWEGYSLADAAKAVHNEFPGKNQADFIDSLLQEGLTMDKDIMPHRSNVEFVRGAVALAEINTWAVSTVSSYNFQTKWHVGRARPEEVAFKVKEDIEEGNTICFPDSIKSKISQLNFETAPEFTAYPEGSPPHPSWPAMHSAASSASLWLPVVANLTPEQLKQSRLIDYSVSYSRTIAGVHYTHDNLFGLTLGQTLIAMEFPKFMEERFGSDYDKVKEKIDQFRFNWNDFTPEVGC